MSINFRSAKILFLAALTATMIGCGGSRDNFVFTNNNGAVLVATVSGSVLTPANTTVTLGRQVTYILGLTLTDNTVVPATGVSYASSDPSIITIDPDTGVATAIMVGTATITATDGTFTETTSVTVTAADVTQTPGFNLIVSNADDADLDIFDVASNIVGRTFDSMRNQGIALDALGTGLHNGGDMMAIISRLIQRDGAPTFQSTAFDINLDRNIDLSGITNVSAKGSALAQTRGILTIANFSSDAANASLIVVGTGGTDPIDIPTTSRPWDAAYDEANDRLYVAFTDGTVGVYDAWLVNALGNTPSGTPTRTINITGLDNAHGIVISGDTLIVSDVGAATTAGDAGFDTDGEIYLLSGASTASGATTADAVIAGSNTQLGNPVDIDLRNGDLRVAEKANDQILIFTDILVTPGGNLTPTVQFALETPESLASIPETLAVGPDASDLDGTNGTVTALLVGTENATLTDDRDLIHQVNPELTTNTTIFDDENRVLSIVADRQGDVFVGNSNDCIDQLGRLANGFRTGESFNDLQDRIVYQTGFVEALDVWDAGGLLFLSGDAGIDIVGKYCDDEDLASLETGTNFWGIDYDPIGDDLYVVVEATNEIRVFQDVVANNFVEGNITTRTITVTGGVSLHGLVHDAANNRLIVTDIGGNDDDGTVDGAIHIVPNASTASGNEAPTASIVGAATLLEDPFDVVYDGTFVYIADADAGQVSRFNISAALTGAVNQAPETNRVTLDGAEALTFIIE